MKWLSLRTLTDIIVLHQSEDHLNIISLDCLRFLHSTVHPKVDTHWFLALGTKAVPAVETGDFKLISVIDEAAGTLMWSIEKRNQEQ